MADASYQWTNFLGGEWSGASQGRIDLPAYRTALNLSANGLPMEEGAWTRRSARRRLGATAYLASGRTRTFWLPGHVPCYLELTYSNANQQSYLRFWTQQYAAGLESDDPQLLCDDYVPLTSLSVGSPAVATLARAPNPNMNGAAGWQNSDEAIIYIDPTIPLANAPLYCNRQFRIQNVGTNQWALYDALTGQPFNSGQEGGSYQQLGNSYIGHVVRFNGPWKSLAEVRNIKIIQSGASANAAQAPAFLTSGLSPPQALTLISPAPATAPSANTPWFTVGAASLTDGPYLDPLPGKSQTGNSIGVIKNLGGVVGGQVFGITDGSYNFQVTDIGRAIRLWWQPQQWAPGMPLSYPGDGFNQVFNYVTRVTYNGSYWQLGVSPTRVTGTFPAPGGVVAAANQAGGASLDQAWLLLPPTAAFWLYGTISAVSSVDPSISGSNGLPGPWCNVNFGASVTALLNSMSLVTNGVAYDTAAGNQIDTWRLGVYTATQTGVLAGGYPTNGFFNDGRVHFLGALANRGDASAPLGVSVTPPYGPGPGGFAVLQPVGTSSSVAYGVTVQQWPDPSSPYYLGMTSNLNSYATPCFSPTVLQGGAVLASNAFSYTVDAAEENEFLWGVPYNEGVVLGTKGGEFRLVGGSLEQPQTITPANVLVRKVTKYGGGPAQPLQVGMAIIFIQSLTRRLMEYVIDIFSHKFQGRHLNEYAKHIGVPGFDELAYQEEIIPLVWANDAAGNLASCTYRRFVSGFVQADPQFMAWARHPLPDGRKVVSITNGANQAGTLDQLVMMTTDGVDA